MLSETEHTPSMLNHCDDSEDKIKGAICLKVSEGPGPYSFLEEFLQLHPSLSSTLPFPSFPSPPFVFSILLRSLLFAGFRKAFLAKNSLDQRLDNVRGSWLTGILYTAAKVTLHARMALEVWENVQLHSIWCSCHRPSSGANRNI